MHGIYVVVNSSRTFHPIIYTGNTILLDICLLLDNCSFRFTDRDFSYGLTRDS